MIELKILNHNLIKCTNSSIKLHFFSLIPLHVHYNTTTSKRCVMQWFRLSCPATKKNSRFHFICQIRAAIEWICASSFFISMSFFLQAICVENKKKCINPPEELFIRASCTFCALCVCVCESVGICWAVDEVDILITILINCKHDRDEIRFIITHPHVFQHNFSFSYM